MTGHPSIDKIFLALEQGHAEKDAAAILACYTPDALIYNLPPPLQGRGLDRGETEAWLATWDGPVRVSSADVGLQEGADLAWSTALNRMQGRKRDGETVDMWFRTTMCFRKTGGRWLIVHEHASVPFYMDGSYRAATDLQPAD